MQINAEMLMFLEISIINYSKNIGIISQTAEIMNKNYSLKRSYKDGNAKINAFSDDYALTSEGFIKLYQVTGNNTYLLISKLLTDFLFRYFYDNFLYF